MSELLKSTSHLSEKKKSHRLSPQASSDALCVPVITPNRVHFFFFFTVVLTENHRGLPAASGGPAAGGNRDLWPAGPCSEVHHLGYNPPLQRPGALQQGSGTVTGPSTDVHCLTTTHTRSCEEFVINPCEGVGQQVVCLFLSSVKK